MGEKYNRREFLKKGLAGSLGIAAGTSLLSHCSLPANYQWPTAYSKNPLNEVKIGFIGVGGMGSAHVRNLLNIKGAKIVAVCDIVEDKVKRIQNWHKEQGKPIPDGYSRGEHDYKRMCQRDDLDLVYIATPWRWHVPMALEAMNTGKHVATEVPAATTVEGCWKLVETSQKTQKHCSMMENCNYDSVEMMILNMVKKGLFGELVHAQCGYLHDLRGIKFSDQGEGLWRRKHSRERDGDLYPTHGLGPIAQCMDINRGNYFKYIVSMSSKTRGLPQYAEEHFGIDSPEAKENFKLGDVVITLIKTYNDENIVLTHDTNLPRPYSRDIYVQGTEGVIRKYPEPMIHLEGKSPHHRWEDIDKYMDKYEHPLWTKMREKMEGAAGHGGMDYLEDYRLIQAYLNGVEPDMNVFDAAMLSAISELSERSIENESKAIEYPDFTKGMWKKSKELHVMNV